jgi:enamine deaminase RidA (YjgF/YER057c/UK114 family)
MMMSSIDAGKLVEAYIKMRDARAKLKKDFDIADTKIEEQQDIIAGHLLNLCKETGADSVRTAAGTVTKIVKSRYWTSDWNALQKFIVEHDAFDLLEQRVHQTHMRQFLENNPGQFPPGMNVDNRYTVSVRRPS